MAFNDIKTWRAMMDAEDQERQAYDNACAAAELRAQKAEQDEYDEIDQAPVDPETCMCRCGNDGCVCLDDLEDDEVDFSAYGIDEADLGVGPADEHYPTANDLAREPLVRIPAAAGRPASDADLVAQDVVRLMAEALRKAKLLDGLGDKRNSGRSAGALREGAESLIDEIRAKGRLDGLRPGWYKDPEDFLDTITNVVPIRYEGDDKWTLKDIGPGDEFYILDSSDGYHYWLKRFADGSAVGCNIMFRADDAENREWLEESGWKATGMLKEADDTPPAAEKKIQDMAQNDDYPISDEEWDEIDRLKSPGEKIAAIRKKVEPRWQSLSAEAKRKIRADIDFLRDKIFKSSWSKKQYEEALRLQRESRKRELTPEEKERFAYIIRFGLDDVQRGKLRNNLVANGFQIPREGRKTIVPKSDAQSGNVRDFHTGEDSKERSNETGLDSEFDISKYEYVPEPMEPGTEIPADFNPEYDPSSTAPNLHLQRDMEQADELISRKVDDQGNYVLKTGKRKNPETGEEEDWPEGYEHMSPEDWDRRKKRQTRKDAAQYMDDHGGYTDNPRLWNQIVGMLEPDEVEEIKADLARELPGETSENKRMLDYMFGNAEEDRKPLTLRQQDMGATWGYGGDQKGKTGGVTQQGDNIINLLLYAMASYLNVGTDHLERFWKNLLGQSTSQREVRKELRPVLFDEICQELGINLDNASRELGVKPEYEAGAKAKRAADKMLVGLFIREYDHMSRADRQRMDEIFQRYSSKKHRVKLGTGLNPDQNGEFQGLIIKMREEGDLPDGDRVRLVQLDIMRTQDVPEQLARQQAERKVRDMTEDAFVEYTTNLAKKFVAGHSQNVTRDTIQVPNRAR